MSFGVQNSSTNSGTIINILLVCTSRGGAVAHYHRYALKKQMAVGPLFDTRAYLLANPDVAGAGHNPRRFCSAWTSGRTWI